MEKNGKIIEINQHVRDALNQWADITLEMEVKQWAYMMDYFPRDLMNATYLFQHVASNIGIKNGHINEERAMVYGERLRRRVKAKVVTPFSLVTVIFSLYCSKMVLTIYRPKP